MQIRRHFTHGVILPRLGPGKSEPRQLTLSGVCAQNPSMSAIGIFQQVRLEGQNQLSAW
jgi:hypothetical protein